MKCLKGFEAQTLIIDKILDNPKTEDKEMRIIVGFILQSVMTDKFMEAIEKLKSNQSKKNYLLKEWNNALKHVYIGQGMDFVYSCENKPINLKEYFIMIKETTAMLLLLPLRIGCVVNGFGEKETEKIMQYGINLGLAFQIKDDYEDFENDVFEGKQRIFVTNECLEILGKQDMQFIVHNYKRSPEECIIIIKKSKIPKKVIEINEDYVSKAIRCLDGMKGETAEKLRYIANLCKIQNA